MSSALAYDNAIKRIQELEKLNASLAAEVDRQRPVVEAAQAWYHGAQNWLVRLARAVADYEAEKDDGQRKD